MTSHLCDPLRPHHEKAGVTSSRPRPEEDVRLGHHLVYIVVESVLYVVDVAAPPHPLSVPHPTVSEPGDAGHQVGGIGDGRGGMWFRCMHAHCDDKGWADYRHVTIPPRVVRSGGHVLAGSVFGGAS